MSPPIGLGRNISSVAIEPFNEQSNNEILSKLKKNINYHDDEGPESDWPIAVGEEEIRKMIFAFLANVEETHAQQPQTIDRNFIFDRESYRVLMTRNGLKYAVLLPRKVAGHTKSDEEGGREVRGRVKEPRFRRLPANVQIQRTRRVHRLHELPCNVPRDAETMGTVGVIFTRRPEIEGVMAFQTMSAENY
uniref:Uncharacterized protein n=1 Tax=Glossina pallidipes TaxID=7398 RepID=A0A1B0AJF0_GLOPL